MERNIDRVRMVDYLRLSLTDRCNLNCIYCTPLKKSQFLSHQEVLSYEEIVKVVSLFVRSGIKNLRLTGGEPLIKKDLLDLIKMLKSINGLEEIAMTTNGVNLKAIANRLKEAGLDRVNISLDTLKRERFKQITGLDYLNDVLSGIDESLEAGFDPVKLNVILMSGINDDELLDFAKLTVEKKIIVRFIEFFPTNKRSNELAGRLIRNEIAKQKIIERFGELEKTSGIKGNGPAEYYEIKGSSGALGFISNASDDFCDECNRIRIDCAGRISPCLFSGYVYDLRPLLRNGAIDDELLMYIEKILKMKPNYSKKKVADNKGIEMSSVGG